MANLSDCKTPNDAVAMARDYEHLKELGAADSDEFKGWPGDGSGVDDLADYNQNEANDYREE